MKEMICPRWGRCKATKQCPLQKTFKEMCNLKVMVLGKCIGYEKGLVCRKI